MDNSKLGALALTLTLGLPAIASAEQRLESPPISAATVPIITETGPSGSASVNVGISNGLPTSIGMTGTSDGYTGGVTLHSGGSSSVTFGTSGSGTSVSGRVTVGPNGGVNGGGVGVVIPFD